MLKIDLFVMLSLTIFEQESPHGRGRLHRVGQDHHHPFLRAADVGTAGLSPLRRAEGQEKAQGGDGFWVRCALRVHDWSTHRQG